MIRVTTASELSQQRNDAITYFTCSSISWHWELFFENHSRERFPPIAASMFEICKSVIEIFWDKDFVVRNTVKNGQSWCSAIICRKRSAFATQFHLIVVSIFLKTRVKDKEIAPADCQKVGFDLQVSRRSCQRFFEHFGLL